MRLIQNVEPCGNVYSLDSTTPIGFCALPVTTEGGNIAEHDGPHDYRGDKNREDPE